MYEGLVAAATLVARRIQICAPGEVLVLSGRPGPEGISFSIINSGRVLPMPLLQSVDHLSLAPMTVTIPIHSAPCRGHEVSLRVSAQVRILEDPRAVYLAARLLLGMPQEQVTQLASRVIQGAVREALATVEHDELRGDPLLVSQRMHEHAQPSLERLGLGCDHLTVELK